MGNKLIILFLSLLIVLFSCQSKNGRSIEHPELNQLDTITYQDDSSKSFVVYVPLNISPSKIYPVIYCFDPQARGRLPVNLLSAAAERYGFIVAGSNVIENNTADPVRQVNAFMQEVASAYPLDTSRQYCVGFSGGGRLAFATAAFSKNIKAVISYAAGLPPVKPGHLKDEITFIGIVGKRDFNYFELVDNEFSFHDPNLQVSCFYFDGGHEWPPVDVLNEAVLYFYFDAMRSGHIPGDKDKIRQYQKSVDKRIKKAGVAEKTRLNKRAGLYLNGLVQVADYRKEYRKLLRSDDFDDYQEKLKLLKQQEGELQQSVLQAFRKQDKEWWKVYMHDLEDKMSGNDEQANLYARLKGFIGMVSYTNANNLALSADTSRFRKVLDVYSMAEPMNPDYLFFEAVYYQLLNDSASAYEMLEQAEKAGLEMNAQKSKILLRYFN